ncbi:MAG: hypothetical protein F4X41_03230 [Chloroflexi bacterium]|nr:hypothetical protein [Chloroflexota bacterium]
MINYKQYRDHDRAHFAKVLIFSILTLGVYAWWLRYRQTEDMLDLQAKMVALLSEAMSRSMARQ